MKLAPVPIRNSRWNATACISSGAARQRAGKISGGSLPPCPHDTCQKPGHLPLLAAFTLVELMVVVGLIAIMIAIIAPEMKGTFESALLRSTGRNLVIASNLAYSQSVTLNQPHHLRLDPRGGRYWIERPAPPGSGETGFLPLRDLPGSEGKLDQRIRIEIRKGQQSPDFPDSQSASFPRTQLLPNAEEEDAGLSRDSISFYPDGTADPAEISLRDREGFGIGLKINPITSRVRIVKLERN